MSDELSLIAALKFATTQINRHGSVFVILFGTIGNLLSIFVLNDRFFSENSCTVYLWWSSIASIIFIWSGLLTRTLEGYGITWPNQTQPVCKIRLLILTVCWAIATWAFVGASMDRYLCSSSSVVFRARSTIRTARQFLTGISIISTIIFIEVLYCYEASVPNVPVACYSHNLACQLYNDWMTILYIIAVPSIFMSVFGILTVLNIRKRIIHPVTATKKMPIVNRREMQPHLKRIDHNLRKILFIQTVALLFLNLPIAIQRFYSTVTSDLPKSSLRVAIENLIYSIIILLRFITYSMSFYIYVLNSSMYRGAFKRQLYTLKYHNSN